MVPVQSPAERTGFEHHACLYGSDDEFLAMAVPFVREGLAAGEPVLAATTSANLGLLSHALGDLARDLDYAETAYFGRRPPQRVAAFDRYLKRHAGRTGRIRVLAEPIWVGRSEAEIRAWKQMEANLNLVFAGTRMRMICPYDTRMLRADIVADASRTHPSRMTGTVASPNADYADPASFVATFDAGVLPPPPADAPAMTAGGDLAALRSFVARAAAAHGLRGDDAALFVVAAAEAARYLGADVAGTAVAVWELPGAVLCDLHQPAGRVPHDPLPGMRPPELDEPQPADGLWLARQICESVQVQTTDTGCTIRLRVPSAHVLV